MGLIRFVLEVSESEQAVMAGRYGKPKATSVEVREFVRLAIRQKLERERARQAGAEQSEEVQVKRVVTIEDDGGVEARFAWDAGRWSDEDGDAVPELIAGILHNLVQVVECAFTEAGE